MARVLLQIITPLPIDLFLCRPCEQFLGLAGAGAQAHREVQGEFPDDLRREAAELSRCLADLGQRFGRELQVQVIDPQSIPGVLLSLRHRVRGYPAYVVNGRRLPVVAAQGLEAELEPLLSASAGRPSRTEAPLPMGEGRGPG